MSAISKERKYAMLFIHKITSHPTVDFAAAELKKYLRMMMPTLPDVKIDDFSDAKDGFRLGLMQDFALDVSDAKDPEVDDIVYMETDERGGIIAGDNPRAVLLAVYEYLRQNGCRWLFPGIDGEYIPMKPVEGVSYRHLASLRFRGPCIEGSTSQEILLETIDFLPKVGMNLFQMQFFLPTIFYRRYYDHEYNNKDEFLVREILTDNNILQWKTACETELSKRSLQIHDVGHGWAVAPFGINTSSAWAPIDESDIPETAWQYLAQLGGKRKLHMGSPLFTQFCMSNPEARKIFVDYVADYATQHPYVDFLHVYLGDGRNNYCECEECVKETVSDQYVRLLNELDAELSARGLKTRIFFAVYQETTWAPLIESIRNPSRFTLQLAPFFRSFTHSLTGHPTEEKVPFVRNKTSPIIDLDTYLSYLEDWKKQGWTGETAAFEYHFWRHQHFEPSGVALAKRIYEDAEAYHSAGINGMLACGSQRSYFPSGFAYYVFARKLFDLSLSYEALQEDYFSHAYGEDWQAFYAYLEEVYDAFGFGFLEGEESKDTTISPYYNPERDEMLTRVSDIAARGRELFRSHRQSPDRVKSVSVKLLTYHAAYIELLADALIAKAEGRDDEALAKYDKVRAMMSDAEPYLERYFDFLQAIQRTTWLLQERGTGQKSIN